MWQLTRAERGSLGVWNAVRGVLAGLALAMLCVGASMAQAPGDSPAIAWRRGETRNYEPQSPGLGVSQRYSAAVGWIDVYVYDMRRKDWKEGTDDPQFAAHFGSTIDEVRYFAEQGRYTDLKIGPEQDAEVAGQRFRSVSFAYARGGQALRSTTYLTVRNGSLLKYRVSIFAATGLDVDTVARQFVESNLRGDPIVNSI
jgi:hypothetical protein